jgi:hypothetical protein
MNHVIAGWGHSCLLTSDGVAYVCGRNQHGQLGLGSPTLFPLNERNHHYQPYFIPLLSLLPHHLTHVSCGGEHSVFLSNTHELFSTGRGHKGQLGHGDQLDCFFPTCVKYFSTLQRKVHQVVCGNSATVYLIGRYREPMSLVERCIEEWNHTMVTQSQRGGGGAGGGGKKREERGREMEVEGGGEEEEEEEEIKWRRKRNQAREIFNRNTALLRTILPPHQSQLLREWRQDD